jgi:hypothetical protein
VPPDIGHPAGQRVIIPARADVTSLTHVGDFFRRGECLALDERAHVVVPTRTPTGMFSLFLFNFPGGVVRDVHRKITA